MCRLSLRSRQLLPGVKGVEIQEADFRPPLGFRNPWLQSALGQVWPGPVSLPNSSPWTIALPGNEWLIATHTPPLGVPKNNRAVILVHGLGGNQGLFHIMRLAKALVQRGYHVIRMNMRGCGPSQDGSPNALLGGHSDDLALIVLAVQQRLKIHDIDLLGYSFGGNMVLRYVGAQAQAGYSPVSRCYAISAPVDLEADVRKLKRVFPSLLKRRVANRLSQMVKQADPRAKDLESIKDFTGFEQGYIAKVLGQGNSEIFYRSISAGLFVDKITTPTHIIWSQDDPVVDVDAYRNYRFSNYVKGVRTRFGGHVGFCRPMTTPPKRWWIDELLLDLLN